MQKGRSHQLDERQHRNIEKASFQTLVLVIVFDCVMMLYFFLQRNIDSGMPYALQLLIMAVGMLLFLARKGEVDLPKSILTSRTLDPAPGMKMFFSRLKWYALDAMIMLIGFTALHYYQTRSFVKDTASTMIVSFLIVTALYAIIGEIGIRRYRRQMQQMDEEENN